MNPDETRMIPGEVVVIAKPVGNTTSIEEHWLSRGRQYSISLYATDPHRVSMVVRVAGQIDLNLTTTHFEVASRPKFWPNSPVGTRHERPMALNAMRSLRDAYVFLFSAEETTPGGSS